MEVDLLTAPKLTIDAAPTLVPPRAPLQRGSVMPLRHLQHGYTLARQLEAFPAACSGTVIWGRPDFVFDRDHEVVKPTCRTATMFPSIEPNSQHASNTSKN